MRGPVQQIIEEKIKREFHPVFVKVINESQQHSVPKNSETHFRIELVSALFAGLSRVDRFRKVHDALNEELENGVHALSLKLFTPEEWSQKGGVFGNPSPPCAHTKTPRQT